MAPWYRKCATREIRPLGWPVYFAGVIYAATHLSRKFWNASLLLLTRILRDLAVGFEVEFDFLLLGSSEGHFVTVEEVLAAFHFLDLHRLLQRALRVLRLDRLGDGGGQVLQRDFLFPVDD